MPIYRVEAQEIDLPRRIALLDTNVLVSFADPDDKNHEHTKEVIQIIDYTWVVLYTVIVESWNFLRGKLKKPQEADYLLQWLLTPGNVHIIYEQPDPLPHHRNNISVNRVDLVDAALMKVATDLSRSLGLQPFAHVATYDLRDFPRCRLSPNFSFNVFDMVELTSSSEL